MACAAFAKFFGFDFYQARMFYSKTIDLRTDFQVGVFGNHYTARFGDARSNSGGVTGSVTYNWSPVLHSSLSGSVQQTDFKETRDDGLLDVKSHPWSAVVNTVYDAGSGHFASACITTTSKGASSSNKAR